MNIGKFFLFLSFFLISFLVSRGQKTGLFWEPEVSYNWSTSDRWSYNVEVTALAEIFEQEQWRPGLQRAEAAFFASRSLFGDRVLSGGYQFRWAEPFFADRWNYEHRFMEQFAFFSYLDDRRVAHRIRLEQRIFNDSYMNRLRYRLSYEWPLQGRRLDPGEQYLVGSNEVLFFFNSQEAGLDDRITLALGWYFNDKQKLETGLQYRSERFLSNVSHIFHIVTSYYINQ